jgi:hypothetical protein
VDEKAVNHLTRVYPHLTHSACFACTCTVGADRRSFVILTPQAKRVRVFIGCRRLEKVLRKSREKNQMEKSRQPVSPPPVPARPPASLNSSEKERFFFSFTFVSDRRRPPKTFSPSFFSFQKEQFHHLNEINKTTLCPLEICLSRHLHSLVT